MILNLPAADLKLSARAPYENIVLRPVRIVVKEEMAPTMMLKVGFDPAAMIGEALRNEPKEATVPRTCGVCACVRESVDERRKGLAKI
jgi:hypothetical protein